MSAIDYWYQKYRKERLTWEDIAKIVTIYEHEIDAGNINRYEDNGSPSVKEASEIILRRFNEIREK